MKLIVFHMLKNLPTSPTLGNSTEFFPALLWYSGRWFLIWLTSFTSFIQQTLTEYCWTPERQVKSLFPTMRSSQSGRKIASAPCMQCCYETGLHHAGGCLEGAEWLSRQEEKLARPPGKVMPQLSLSSMRQSEPGEQRWGRECRGVQRAFQIKGMRCTKAGQQGHLVWEEQSTLPGTMKVINLSPRLKLGDNVNTAISINFLFRSCFLLNWLPSSEKTALWPWEFGCKYNSILSCSCVHLTTGAVYW